MNRDSLRKHVGLPAAKEELCPHFWMGWTLAWWTALLIVSVSFAGWYVVRR